MKYPDSNKCPDSYKLSSPSHSSTLAWKIPWAEEPGRLQSMGSRRVGHDWVTSPSLFTFMHWRRKWQPTPVFLPGESQGRGSLVGCSLWGHEESDTTEWLNFHFHFKEELYLKKEKQTNKKNSLYLIKKSHSCLILTLTMDMIPYIPWITGSSEFWRLLHDKSIPQILMAWDTKTKLIMLIHWTLNQDKKTNLKQKLCNRITALIWALTELSSGWWTLRVEDSLAIW